jgi:methionyl-tRNA synthetase
MHIQRAKEAETNYEYGCDLRRLYPWKGVADPLWGSAIASVRPGELTTPHDHDEDETFLILSGRGLITVDDETAEVEARDVIFLPRGSRHTIQNLSQDGQLEFLTIYWGSPEAAERMVEMARELTAGAASNEPE